MKTREEIRAYLKSARCRLLSWGSIGLLLAWWWVHPRREWLLYLAGGMSFLAMLPLYPSFSEMRQTNIDVKDKKYRVLVILIALALIALLIVAVLLVIYDSHF